MEKRAILGLWRARAPVRVVKPRTGSFAIRVKWSVVDLYSARVSRSASIAEDVDYVTLLQRIAEYTLRAAFARAADRHDCDQENLRLKGLRAIELFHDGRAIWQDRVAFEQLRADAAAGGGQSAFEQANELDLDFVPRIDRDLRERWRVGGYLVPSLALDMKKLFSELEADALDSASNAQSLLLSELLRSTGPRSEKAAPGNYVGEGNLPNP
jgi:hypothetical protein